MRQTKKLTLGAMMIALGVAFMAIGAYVEVMDLTVAAFLSLLVAFCCMELGTPYNFAVWLGTSLIGALLFTYSFVWMTYLLIFGIYPIVKGYVERTKRIFWIILKLVFVNLSLPVLMLLTKLITGAPLFAVKSGYLVAALYILCVGAFFLYDIFLTVMIRAYLSRLRPRIASFLK
jgi:hypothetical protein